MDQSLSVHCGKLLVDMPARLQALMVIEAYSARNETETITIHQKPVQPGEILAMLAATRETGRPSRPIMSKSK